MKTIDDFDVAGRRVLVRADLNVPLQDGRITDDGRVRASVPTIEALAGRGARVLVCSHLGRPKGEVAPEFSLRPLAQRLGDVLGRDVRFAGVSAGGVAGDDARATADQLGDGEIGMLENLRFEPGETSNDDGEREQLAGRLAALADRYVGDGFGAVHRKHASVYDLPRRLPHAAGKLIVDEVTVLRQLTGDPKRPYAVVLGGAKVSDKLGVIANLLGTVDRLLIGGGMSYTFLAAKGYEVGSSLLESDQIGRVRGFIADAEARGVDLVLPVDVVAATELAADASHEVVPVDAIPADREGCDIGPETRRLFGGKLADARTVFWNGPMGVFELDAFAHGTRAVAEVLTRVDGLTVVGGGDSAAAVRKLGLPDDSFSHISTGGGASLEYLEGRTLPGLTVLQEDEPTSES